MEFRILGPLEVVRDAGPLDVGGPRQQTVLANLLLESPRVVSVERLVDAVWPDAPPATARSQIQICVSSLRQRLGTRDGPATISTRRPGYALDVGEAALDLRTFEAQVSRARGEVSAGRLGEAAHLLHDALGQWRGLPLAGIESPAIRDAATRLAEIRMTVLEEYSDLELRLGHHSELIAVLGPEVDRHPLRERLRGQLMLALYRAGRQADALSEFRRARRVSVDELGIEPAGQLGRLEQAILRGDPSLTRVDAPTENGATQFPVTVPRLLPMEVADFTGRSEPVADAVAHLSPTRVGRGPSTPPTVVITGQGGIGKSVLALHIAHLLADKFPDGQLYVGMHGETNPIQSAQALERFLRALGVPGALIPESLDERAELYRDRLADRHVLVVLDDVASESQVLPLFPPGGSCAVLITSRRRLTAVPGTARIELQTFSPESAMALLGRVIGQDRVRAAADDAAELVRLCGYLPLAVRIAAARLAARPHWSLGTMVDRLSDESTQLDELRHGDMAVRASLLLTYEALDPEARKLLRLLGLIDGPDFGAWACSALLDVPPRTAQDLLDELLELHLVDVDVDTDIDPAAARYRLHDLVRLFVRERAASEDSAEARKAATTRFLGAMLHLAENAHRHEYGGDFLLVHGEGVRYPLDERVTRRLLAQPLQWFARERQTLVAAVAQASATGLGQLCWDLAVSSVALFEVHAHFADWRQTHEIALAAARRERDRLGEAVVLYSMGSLHMFEQQFTDAERYYAEAMCGFIALDCAQGVAMVLRNQAFSDRVAGRYAQARCRNEEALDIFRETGDRVGEAYVLSNLAQIDLDLDRDDDALGLLSIAADICTAIQNRRVEAQVMHRLGEAHLRRRNFASAKAAFSRVLQFACQSGDRIAETYGLVGLGTAAMERGTVADARATLVRAEQLAADLGEQRVQTRALLLLSSVSIREGNGRAARQDAERALTISLRLRTPLWIAKCLTQLGDVHVAEGDHERAVDSWTEALNHLRTITPPVTQLAAELASRLAHAAGPVVVTAPRRPCQPHIVLAAK